MTKQTFVWVAVLGGTIMGSGCADDRPSAPTTPVEVGAITGSSIGAKAAATRLFVPPPDPGAVKQIASLVKARDLSDALKLTALAATPQAVWFTGGTAADVKKAVGQTMAAASCEGRVPVLVAYNIPFRDCAGYSAGGAADTASYEAWIAGFAAGIGKAKADVILEPDGLGIIPYNTTIYGAADWCQPTITDSTGATVPAPGASSDERYAQFQAAIATLKAVAPNASVYLDGTHSAWLGVGEAAYRIHKAGFDPNTGAQLVKGFFLNVSNYQPTDQSIQFGTWVSQCMEAAIGGASWALGHFDYCPSQYDPATGYGLDYSAAYEATVTASLASMLNGAVATLPFVIDTSRNGNGPLDTDPYAAAPYNQSATVISGLSSGDWCNPPGAGAGLRPTASTGVPLVDAYLWVKIPGESDGQCDIAGGARAWDYTAYNPWNLTGDAQNTFDPLWGMVDPAAGVWFPAQALQLAQLAVPPLL
ncbi:MAG TPA: glycoside hydrolase family 6 protein [Polyangia bacterium]|nr:glycoside hydrolase family 6 protein [Polyangia bacterium]